MPSSPSAPARRAFVAACLTSFAVSLLAASPAAAQDPVFRPKSSNPREFAELAGVAVFFGAVDDEGTLDLYRTDGTAAGTTRLGICSPRCPTRTGFLAVPGGGGQAFFFAEQFLSNTIELWRTDGSVEGTLRLTSLPPGGQGPSHPTSVVWMEARQQLYFPVVTLNGSSTLWATDGSRAGTRPVRPFGSDGFRLAALGDRLLLGVVSLGAAADVAELWVSDGTPEGTVPLATVGQGVTTPVALGERAVFLARDATPGRCGATLWATDGTAAGTQPLQGFDTPACEPLTALERAGDWATFVVAPGALDNLWRTDGTVAGTFALTSFADVDAFAFSGSPVWQPPFLYFVAGAGSPVGPEIWRTQGTPGTTELVADLCPGTCSVQPVLLGPADGGRVLFRAGDFFSGYEPWITDGTAAGTRRLAEVQIGWHTVLGGRLMFSGFTQSTGWEAWSVPLSGGGATKLTDLESLAAVGFTADSVGRLGDVALFAATDPLHGTELWRSDGTVAGTFLLANLVADGEVPQAPPGVPSNLTVVPLADNALQVSWDPVPGAERYFLSMRGVEGVPSHQELPVFDTVVFPQVPPGSPVSVQVRAENVHGSSPWSEEVSGTAFEPGILPGECPPSDDALCLQDGRFRVRVHWRNQNAPPQAVAHGSGRSIPVPGNETTGYFWFFTDDNVELIVKMLDGTTVNGFHWTFYGALSNVEYWITVVDTLTTGSRTYHNPPGRICGRGDTASFAGTSSAAGARRPAGASPPAAAAPATLFTTARAAAGPCAADGDTLCLVDGRYEVKVEWRNQRNGQAGAGRSVPFTDLSGFFWFFHPDNIELVVKVLDGTPVNGKVWVFYGALTDVGYTLRVRETATGEVAEYVNPPGNICGNADTAAF